MRKVSVLLLVTIISTITFALFTTPQIQTHAPSPSRTAVVPTNTANTTPKVGEYRSVDGMLSMLIGDDFQNLKDYVFYSILTDGGDQIWLETNNQYLDRKFDMPGIRVRVTGTFLSEDTMTVENIELLLPQSTP